jgi:hypothetical protein
MSMENWQSEECEESLLPCALYGYNSALHCEKLAVSIITSDTDFKLSYFSVSLGPSL